MKFVCKRTKELKRWRDAIGKIRRILLLCCLTAYANVMSLHEKANGQQQKQQIPSKKGGDLCNSPFAISFFESP